MPTYDPSAAKPYRLSRSKVEDYIRCPRCFYLDRRLGVSQPSSPPFNLNKAVDTLLKKEFDHYRASGTPHPLMRQNGIKAVPYQHEKLEEWREALRGGISYLHPTLHFDLRGAPDDLWITPEGELLVVDYKATSKPEEVNLNADWQKSYKRQVEFYQWLLRRNGFKVVNRAYFVYANATTAPDAFDHTLRFAISVLPYDGNDEWIEPTLQQIHRTLNTDTPPPYKADCEWCEYRQTAMEKENQPQQKSFL